LIPKKEDANAALPPKARPNGNMAQAHAEIGVIQQAYEQGVTKGQNMTMSVAGMDVCEFCRSDVVAMAKAAELKSLTIYQHKSGATLFWELGMKKLPRRRANENAFIVD